MKKLAYKMEYLHPTGEKSAVALVPYSPAYQAEYTRLYNACYHEMREALDIRPYDFIQDDSFFETSMENVYLLLEQGRILGSVALKGEEIDDLLVAPRCQGRGYGRQILLWALEHMPPGKIVLHVAAWNQKALRLYRQIGFEIVEVIEIP